MILIPVVLCSAYLIMVSLCVCERMTPETNHLTRIVVVLIGGCGAWAFCKAVIFGWGSTPAELLQGVMIVVIAIVIGSIPKFHTGCKQRVASRKRGSTDAANT